LAQLAAPGGTIIAFSTSPGSVARDGSSDKNSVYTKHLLAHLDVPGLPIEQMFKRVRAGVMADTDQAQMPWENSSLIGEFCLRPGDRGSCPDLASVTATSSVPR
jgi:carboxyl-terminal processing protease